MKSLFVCLCSVSVAVSLLAGGAARAGATSGETPGVTLYPGDPAPGLKAARLIKGEAVPRFEPGKIYVLDFWATKCDPCLKSLPHLTELARKYRGKVSFIAVNVERYFDPRITDEAAFKRVTRFVKESGDLFDSFTVIMDDAAQTLDAQWQKASGQLAIPVTYIVADQKVVWMGIGYPVLPPRCGKDFFV